MKNFNLILSFAIVMAVVMYSCKKDLPVAPPVQENDFMTHSQKVLLLIRAFDNKLESNLKTGELITLDSAVWYTEALQNYEYAHPDSGSKNFIVFKSQYTLPVSPGGLVLMDDVETLYGQMETQLLADLAGIPDPVRFLKVTDVALDSIVGNIAHLTISNGLGVGELIIYEPFEEDDDWIWGTLIEPLAGPCEGEYVASDGSNELEYRLNNPNMASITPDGYTDIEIVEASYLTCYYVEPLNPYRVFNSLEPMHCLYNEDLTDYINEYDNIIYNYNDLSNDIEEDVYIEGDNEGARPSGKMFISMKIVDDFYYDQLTYFHRLQITYGTPYNISTE